MQLWIKIEAIVECDAEARTRVQQALAEHAKVGFSEFVRNEGVQVRSVSSVVENANPRSLAQTVSGLRQPPKTHYSLATRADADRRGYVRAACRGVHYSIVTSNMKEVDCRTCRRAWEKSQQRLGASP